MYSNQHDKHTGSNKRTYHELISDFLYQTMGAVSLLIWIHPVGRKHSGS